MKLMMSLVLSAAALGADAPKTTVLKNVRITHYCICEKCCGKKPSHPAYGVTASGHKVKDGDLIVAVDRKVIPLRSTVIIDGVSYRALDTGGAIKGLRIDVLVTGPDAHHRALKLGVKRRDVTMVR